MKKATHDAIQAVINQHAARMGFDVASQVFYVKGTSTVAEKMVPQQAVRVVVEEQNRAVGARLRKLGNALEKEKDKGNWPEAVDKWAEQFKAEIRALHLEDAATGHGGVRGLSPEDLDRLEAKIQKQFDFHDKIVAKLKDDPDYVSTPRFYSHADGYAQNARLTYEDERRQSNVEVGFDFEHDFTHSIDGCAECQAIDDLGWVPIDTNPDFGDRICGPGCDCTREFSRGNPNED